MYRVILPDVLVGAALDVQRLLPADVGVVVDGHGVRAHVEAHVVAVEGTAQHTGHDVLAGVLLHVVEPPRPVDMAADLRAHGQRPVAQVGDDAVLLVHVQHPGVPQRAVVGGLPAALRVKGRAVEHHRKAAGHGGAAYDLRGEILHIGIYFV